MSFTSTHIINMGLILVGILLVLESFLIVHGKGTDVNGELPFVSVGSFYIAYATPSLGLLGPWKEHWYWYLFVTFLIFSGFLSYIRAKGFTIRVFGGDLGATKKSLEKALKQAKVKYELKETPYGMLYELPNGKYPLRLQSVEKSPLMKAHIEIIASESLWNADLKHELMVMVQQIRNNQKKNDPIIGLRGRIAFGMILIAVALYLMFIQF